MGSARDELGNDRDLIRAGLRRAGAPRDVPTPPPAGGSTFYGKPPTEAEQMIKAGLAAAGRPLPAGPKSNIDKHSDEIGKRMMDASAERIAREMPYERPSEPTTSAEDYIRVGLRAANAAQAATTPPKGR